MAEQGEYMEEKNLNDVKGKHISPEVRSERIYDTPPEMRPGYRDSSGLLWNTVDFMPFREYSREEPSEAKIKEVQHFWRTNTVIMRRADCIPGRRKVKPKRQKHKLKRLQEQQPVK